MNYITWEDNQDRNERIYTHVGCDTGNGKYIVPLDGCPPPSEADRECHLCAQVVPLISKDILSRLHPDDPLRQGLTPLDSPILVSNMDVNKLVERAYLLGWEDHDKAIKELTANRSVLDENARKALGKLLQ